MGREKSPSRRYVKNEGERKMRDADQIASGQHDILDTDTAMKPTAVFGQAL
jgi:hypothetical protein